ncbi:MAG: APC family permease [Pirellulaceae bacterium]
MPTLKRQLNLLHCTLMGIGVMLGAGIYALVGQAAGMAGNTVWASFLIAGVVAIFTALSYAELSSFIPKAGGQYFFARRAFGPLVGFIVSWLIQVGIAIGSAAVALGFGGYLEALTGIDKVWAASLLIAATACLLVYGIRESAWVAGICTAVEVIGLAIIVVVGLPKLGSIEYFETASAGHTGVWTAAALVFFAYIGFEEIVQLSEETVDSTRVIPLTILLSISITAVLYILVAICAVSVLGWQALGESDAPLADVAAVALGNQAFLLLSIIALFSTGNTVLIFLLSGARLMYGMAEDGALPRSLAKVHKTRHTPFVSSLVVSIAALIVVVVMQDITQVANLTNFALLFAFVVVNASVIALRFREDDVPRPFRIPGNIGKVPVIPVLGMVSSLVMIYFVGPKIILAGSGLIVFGLAVYLIGRPSRLRRSTDSPPSPEKTA